MRLSSYENPVPIVILLVVGSILSFVTVVLLSQQQSIRPPLLPIPRLPAKSNEPTCTNTTKSDYSRYRALLSPFANQHTLAGKAYSIGCTLDSILSQNRVCNRDCSILCHLYQEMNEVLFKHILQTTISEHSRKRRKKYPHTHNLVFLSTLVQHRIPELNHLPPSTKDGMALLTKCAMYYRYNFMLKCGDFWDVVEAVDKEVLEVLVAYL